MVALSWRCELVQNALDAVHLRDQRNRLATALNAAGGKEKPRQPHQSWNGQKAQVNVTWGEDDGRRYIRVQDSGVGMTVGTMRRFLTEIGKSYYKSDDFRAEQELMRRNGILCAAISQFGIGFLSVFMLADEVTIYTRPVGVARRAASRKYGSARDGSFPLHRKSTVLTACWRSTRIRRQRLPGTAVTIWLKKNLSSPTGTATC